MSAARAQRLDDRQSDGGTEQTPKKKPRRQYHRLDRPNPYYSRAPGYLPAEIAMQPALAQRAFTLWLTKPGRRMADIARELGCHPSTLCRLRHVGHWDVHLQSLLAQTPESLVVAAKQETHRYRAELLASNPLRQGLLDAALPKLLKLDENGNPTLLAGVEMRELASFQQAVNTFVKTTQVLTGEEMAGRRAVAAAGAPKIVIDTRGMQPEPVAISARVVSSEVSPPT